MASVGAKLSMCNELHKLYGVNYGLRWTYFRPFTAMDDQISLAASTRTSAAGGDHYSERAWSKLNYYSTNILAPSPYHGNKTFWHIPEACGIPHRNMGSCGWQSLMSIFTNKRRKGKEPEEWQRTKKEQRKKKIKKNKKKTKHRETCTNLELLKLVTQMSRMRSEIPLNPIFYSVLNSIFNIQCPDLHYDIPQRKPTFLW